MNIGDREIHDWYGMHGSALPPPDAIVFYPDGSFLPMMFHFAAESCIPADIAREQGFELKQLAMHDALADDHPLAVAYENGSGEVVRDWNPERIEGWTLVGKHDSEDGPVAIYSRKRA